MTNYKEKAIKFANDLRDNDVHSEIFHFEESSVIKFNWTPVSIVFSGRTDLEEDHVVFVYPKEALPENNMFQYPIEEALLFVIKEYFRIASEIIVESMKNAE